VRRLVPPKAEFKDLGLRSAIPQRSSIPLGAAKRFQMRRIGVFKKHIVINTYAYEFSHPKIEMNNLRKANLSPLARTTPFWQAVRVLFLDGLDVGKISYGLSGRDLSIAIQKFPLAENPYEARATGGYTVTSLYSGNFGMSTEQYQLTEFLKESRQVSGHFIYKKDVETIPASQAFNPEVDQSLIERRPPKRLKTQNPYLVKSFETIISGEDPRYEEGDTPREVDLSEINALLEIQLFGEPNLSNAHHLSVLDNWEDPEEFLFPQGVEDESPQEQVEPDLLDSLYDLVNSDIDDELITSPHHRPVSPSDTPTGGLAWVL